MPAIVTAESLPDPMRPGGYGKTLPVERQASAEMAWNLTSTLVSAQRRLAMINNHMVAVNDWVGGARVVRIASSHVLLDYQGRSLRLELVAGDMRQLKQ